MNFDANQTQYPAGVGRECIFAANARRRFVLSGVAHFTVGHMSESRSKMVAKLRELVVPQLRKRGFRGTFPHYRRQSAARINVLTFQFSRWGGSFVVEVGSCPSSGVVLHTGELIGPAEVKAHHIFPRLRLGSNPPNQTDHWFDYESATYGESIYQMMAEEVLMCIPQAEQYWSSKK